MQMVYNMKNEIINLLKDKKVDNIQVFDLSNNSNKLMDYCIIGSGISSKHTQAVAEYLSKLFKSNGIIPNVEGNASDGWVTVVASGIEIHLFKPDIRSHYDIESFLLSLQNISITVI